MVETYVLVILVLGQIQGSSDRIYQIFTLLLTGLNPRHLKMKSSLVSFMLLSIIAWMAGAYASEFSNDLDFESSVCLSCL